MPFSPGGPADVLARLLVDGGVASSYGDATIVDNRPGAGGLIGTQVAARAPADGSTFLLIPNFLLLNALIYTKPGYDPFKSFDPVARICTTALVLVVNPAHPTRTAMDLAQSAKQASSPLSYGSPGGGTTTHLYGHVFASQAGSEMTHVAYKGEPGAIADVMSGAITFGFFLPGTVMPLLAAGRLRALAIASASRSPLLPAVPTMREAGFANPLYEADGWFGMFAPAGTPKASIARMGGAIETTLKSPTLVQRFATFGFQLRYLGAAEFDRQNRIDYELWKRIVADAKVQIEN